MDIELFGAAFDPPHYGHYQVIQSALALNIANEVWLIPTGQSNRSKKLTEARHRLTMLELFLEDFKRKPVKIEQYELAKDGRSYTFDTLNHFASVLPEHTFAWIIGSDKLDTFTKWYQAFEILKRFTIHVYPRPGYPTQPLYPGMIPLTHVHKTSISSSEIRTKIKSGTSITGLVGVAVNEYIRENGLYLG